MVSRVASSVYDFKTKVELPDSRNLPVQRRSSKQIEKVTKDPNYLTKDTSLEKITKNEYDDSAQKADDEVLQCNNMAN